jgi:hypothetical protein
VARGHQRGARVVQGQADGAGQVACLVQGQF